MKRYLLYICFVYAFTCQVNAHQVFVNPDSLDRTNIGGGGYESYFSYEREGYKKIEWYKFEPERFPILVCIDPLLSARKQSIVNQAVNLWRNAYHAYVNYLISKRVLFRSDIGKNIPDTNLLQARICNADSTLWYRFIFINEKSIKPNVLGNVLGNTLIHPLRYFWIRFELDFIEIVMNKNIKFNLGKTSIYDDSVYYETVIYHELTHALGLVHSNNSTASPLMHWNAWLCRGKICRPSRKEIENFLDLYVNLEDRRR